MQRQFRAGEPLNITCVDNIVRKLVRNLKCIRSSCKTCHFIQSQDELIHMHLFFCHVIALTKGERSRRQLYNLLKVLIWSLYQIFLFCFANDTPPQFLAKPLLWFINVHKLLIQKKTWLLLWHKNPCFNPSVKSFINACESK